MRIACVDVGFNCAFVAHGESEADVLADMRQHLQAAHGYDERRVDHSELVGTLKACIDL
jgi:predicted small metal-binding protein